MFAFLALQFMSVLIFYDVSKLAACWTFTPSKFILSIQLNLGETLNTVSGVFFVIFELCGRRDTNRR